MSQLSEDLVFSDDKSRLNVELIYRFLSRESYWAKGISKSLVETAIEHSLCYGAYVNDEQVAFARVISDYATFGYLADVFVVPDFRQRGIAKKLMAALLQDERLQQLRRMLLVTQDAHSLYRQFQFEPLTDAERFMQIHRPNLYRDTD